MAALLQRSRSLLLTLLVGVVLTFTLFHAMSGRAANDDAGQLALLKLPLPPLPQADNTAPQAWESNTPDHATKTNPAPSATQKTVQAGKNDVFSTVLMRAGVDYNTIDTLAKLDHTERKLVLIHPGDRFTVVFDAKQQPERIIRHVNAVTDIVAERGAEGWKINTLKKPVDIIITMAQGTIEDSLYDAGKQAGLSDKTIMALANLYQWDIDFARQLRPGDTFKVIYEKRYLDGAYLGDGRILAAEVHTSGKTYTAFALRDASGKIIGYYDEDGHNLRKAFMRNPVDFVHITSRFTRKRWHPTQHKWKAHRGVDYGGKIGTPVHVTGNGRVTFKGWKTGYGRVVFVQHGRRYTTVYAHLSRFGKIRKGSYVKMGQTIGYIGQSGWATGPHLHYEFRIDGKHKDPLLVKFPDASPVPAQYKSAFQAQSRFLMAQLQRLDTAHQLAQSFE
ncbi:Murein DD-endopeptidase MepM and murein hydrolase activator NlpD, contain LysM domain [Sulfurivirga caldicuralii]|uniref:Murein DD-endopeptidase MepM and murein hydrolase activator NlpD, contain LysM domain n=1 Tax=Sulfurivirga caldicuralii TaxID=364032 RepID=A0A1N6GLC0_9GAMM|nr:peptidoglycan DD-metalloendopeptidase family protein [Sulfurivirga caldicuralii]SIO08281.1 Murein DD-endopeptidase MepM and murein hydrolase activator NlpD, contain LysM domain [Sulfurivirga caldicuralii]